MCSVPERWGNSVRGRLQRRRLGWRVTSKILISGGCVLTLGERTPNHRQADVLIDGDVVAEVGPGLRARDAEQVDATDTIVMPGFVDTHRHTSMSLFRNLGEADGVRSGISPTSASFGDLSAGRRVRRHPHRVARCRRSGDHHRRRLVQRAAGRRARRRRVAGPRRRRPAHRVRPRSSLGRDEPRGCRAAHGPGHRRSTSPVWPDPRPASHPGPSSRRRATSARSRTSGRVPGRRVCASTPTPVRRGGNVA